MNSERWPSTTRILKHFGLMANYAQWGSPEAMTRGRLVTAACHLLAWREPLDASEASAGEWEARHPECAPYIAAYRKFLGEHQVTLIECEREYKSRTLKFISHPDQIVTLDGYGTCNLELKSGSMPGCCQLQTAGQVLAMSKPMRRFGLLLQDDGMYKLYPHDNFRDLDDFRAMVQTWWTIQSYAPEVLAA